MLFLFSLVVRVLARLLVLSGADEATKDLEILVLRQQLRVLRRQAGRPRFTALDRVLLAAASRALPRRQWTSVFSSGSRGLCPRTRPAPRRLGRRSRAACERAQQRPRRTGSPESSAPASRVAATTSSSMVWAACLVTSEPTSATIPAISWPGTRGRFSGPRRELAYRRCRGHRGERAECSWRQSINRFGRRERVAAWVGYRSAASSVLRNVGRRWCRNRRSAT